MTAPARLDVGCGRRKRPGFFGIDSVASEEVDLVADLEQPLPFADGSIREVHCHSVIEHIEEPIAFLDEMHRLLHPKGHIDIFVPHFSNPFGHSDPTHKHLWGLYSFCYLVAAADQPFRRKVPDHYTTRRWAIGELRLYFQGQSRVGNLAARAVGKLVNRSARTQELYERLLCWTIPCYAVVVRMSPVKAASVPPAAPAKGS
jgi:SAM-dependent methyltransferase